MPIKLESVPAEWREAVQKFVNRCEAGEIRSRTTYQEFKTLLANQPPATPTEKSNEAILDFVEEQVGMCKGGWGDIVGDEIVNGFRLALRTETEAELQYALERLCDAVRYTPLGLGPLLALKHANGVLLKLKENYET